MQRSNVNFKTFEATAEALKLKLYWIGGDHWSYPGTGFDVDSLPGHAWTALWNAIKDDPPRVYFRPWTAGMCNLDLFEYFLTGFDS